MALGLPPFGTENIIVYASNVQLGDIDLTPAGGVYEVKTRFEEIGPRIRGLKIKGKGAGEQNKTPVEFIEATLGLRTSN